MNTGKIVVVDDEKMVTSAFKTLFKVEGFDDIHLFNSPKDALIFLNDNVPDLIISDFIMPEMNGLEFLREAKKLYPEVSMILLTGYADKENAIKAINEIGLYKYIEKPWDNDDLILNIKNGIERSHLLENLRNKICELEVAKTANPECEIIYRSPASTPYDFGVKEKEVPKEETAPPTGRRGAMGRSARPVTAIARKLQYQK